MAKKSRIDAIWEKMEKHYGDDFLEDRLKKSLIVETIPTGSIALDEATGIWGLPKGRIIQFAGKESSGKTFISLQVIKKWQSLNPNNWAYFIDAEFSFDEDWAISLGIDMARLRVLPSNDGVEIFTSLCGVPNKDPKKNEKKTPGILDLVKEAGGAKESGLGVIVLDSIAAVMPPMERASGAGKNNMALMARFMPPELRKLTPLLAETGVLFIAINQVRVNPGQMFGNPETTAGGCAWKHHCSVMINFAKVFKEEIINEYKEQVGHKIKGRFDKNKVAPPETTCELDIKYTEGIVHLHKELGELAIKYKVVERPNNRTYVYGEEKIVGKDNFFDYLKANPNLMAELLEKVKKIKIKRDEEVKRKRDEEAKRNQVDGGDYFSHKKQNEEKEIK